MTADAFLAAHGFAHAAREPLAGDAGARRYTRLAGGPAPALLVECPAADESLPTFLRLAAHLRAHGLRAPHILAADPARGLALVEDLGPRTMAEALDAGADPAPLYAEAGRSLARFHACPIPAGTPDWDAERMTEAAAATFLGWWWPAAFGAPPDDATRAAFREAMAQTLAPFAGLRVLTHRDHFPANLVPREDGAMGVIDFQDAARGHPAYDLVSLIEDARRDVAPEARAAALRGYGREVPEAALAAMGAQRHLRVAALWVRLARRDGKPRYLEHGPRCWTLLENALRHEAARPLARFLDARVPERLRCNPPC